MDRIVLKSNDISYQEILECLNYLIELYSLDKLDLYVPSNNLTSDLISDFRYRSYISEIYTYKQFQYENELSKVGFNEVYSLLDLNYDMLNRKGYDLLFIDVLTGKLIIGEVKSSSSNYFQTIRSAKSSLFDKESISNRESTLLKIKNQFKNKTFNSIFIDNEELSINKNAQNNFRIAINSILNYLNTEKSSTEDFKKIENVSLIFISWIDKSKNIIPLNIEELKKYFHNSIVNKHFSNSYNYIFSSALVDIQYKNLYLTFRDLFNQKKLIKIEAD